MRYHLKYRLIDLEAFARAPFEVGRERSKELNDGGITFFITSIMFGIPWAIACFFTIMLMPGKPLALEYEEYYENIKKLGIELEDIGKQLIENEKQLAEARKELELFKQRQSDWHFEKGFLKKEKFDNVTDFMDFKPEKND